MGCDRRLGGCGAKSDRSQEHWARYGGVTAESWSIVKIIRQAQQSPPPGIVDDDIRLYWGLGAIANHARLQQPNASCGLDVAYQSTRAEGLHASSRADYTSGLLERRPALHCHSQRTAMAVEALHQSHHAIRHDAITCTSRSESQGLILGDLWTYFSSRQSVFRLWSHRDP